MKPQDILADIQKFGIENQNSLIVAKYARYFKEGYDAYGLTHEQVTTMVDNVLSMPGITKNILRETSLLLVQSPKYEDPAMAFQLLLRDHKSWTIDTFHTVEQWFALGITNWAHTDYICGEMMNLFFKKNLIGLNSIAGWRTASNKFQRRAAAVSLIKPMKLSSDFSPYFNFIAPMINDPAREVHQGLGWFLRECWKKQPQPTEAFLLKFKDTAPRLIFQYATEKMSKDGKERFRKEKREQ